MVLWDGACIVHEEFKARELEALRLLHPDAKVLVHPESPAGVVAQADVVGSTTALIKAARALPVEKLIVATDRGIFYKMQQAAPGKTLIEAPTAGTGATCRSCGHCPWMAMNGLRKVAASLRSGANEVLRGSRDRTARAASHRTPAGFLGVAQQGDLRGQRRVSLSKNRSCPRNAASIKPVPF